MQDDFSAALKAVWLTKQDMDNHPSLMLAKEIQSISDPEEVKQMLATGNWFVVNMYNKLVPETMTPELQYTMIRID